MQTYEVNVQDNQRKLGLDQICKNLAFHLFLKLKKPTYVRKKFLFTNFKPLDVCLRNWPIVFNSLFMYYLVSSCVRSLLGCPINKNFGTMQFFIHDITYFLAEPWTHCLTRSFCQQSCVWPAGNYCGFLASTNWL